MEDERALADPVRRNLRRDGFAVDLVATVGEARDATAVIVVTARDGVNDRIRGLNAGADDYVVKPFSAAEWTARLRAVPRRPCKTVERRISLGTLGFDTTTGSSH